MPMAADIVIINANIVTMNKKRQIIKNGGIAIVGDKIEAIMDSQDIEKNYISAKKIDAEGKYIFPGLINTHTHLFQCMLKGIGRDKPLWEWLAASVQKAAKTFSPKRVHLAALVGCMDAIRSGVTTTFDYMYCHAQKGLDEAVIKAFEDCKIRGVLCRGYSDTSVYEKQNACPNVDTEDMFFADVESLAQKYKNHPHIGIAMAPGSVYSLKNEDSYRKMRALANKLAVPISMHILETESDDDFYMEKYGLRTVPFLEKTGVLGPDFIAVHCVHPKSEDIELFKKYDVKISHNPAANMILASGVAPVPTFLENGLTVAMGVDGAASNDSQDMLESMKLAALLHKVTSRNAAAISAQDVLEMATVNGAAALGKHGEIGSLEKGKKADLFIYNHLKAKSVPVLHPVTSLVYSSGQSNVQSVIIGGEMVLENGEFCSLNEKDILKKAQAEALEMQKEM